jgi:hypothetical protein
MVRAIFLTAAVIAFSCCSSEGDCEVCQKEKCSDLLALCEKDADCACLARCAAREGIPGVDGCLDECALQQRPADFVPLQQCMATACPDSDECSVPSGYQVEPVAGPGGSTAAADGGNATDAADIGGGELADCSFDPDLAFDADGEILQLQSADGRVCARLDRRNDGPGSLANTKWTLLGIRVGPPGEVSLVDDPGDICWYSSHHNFIDWAHAWTGSRRFDLKLYEDGHGGPRMYELHVFEQGPVDPAQCAPVADGTGPIGDPIALYPVNP